MEHVRRLSDHSVALGLCLGLPAPVSLSHKYSRLEPRSTDAGPLHAPELDVDQQVSQVARSLHTASG